MTATNMKTNKEFGKPITVKSVGPDGKKVNDLELAPEYFSRQVNVPLIHQVATAQLNARRSGTQSTKTRSEVSGGGAKPFRQKGTGRARQGSIRSPLQAGGGVAHGPKPRSYAEKTPKKMVRAGLLAALSDRASSGDVIVIENWTMDSPSTKSAMKTLADVGIDSKALLVLGDDDENIFLSVRNIPEIQVVHEAELNAYDVMVNKYIVFTSETLLGNKKEEASSYEVQTENGSGGEN